MAEGWCKECLGLRSTERAGSGKLHSQDNIRSGIDELHLDHLRFETSHHRRHDLARWLPSGGISAASRHGSCAGFRSTWLVLISTGGNGHTIRRIYPEIDIVGEAVSYPQTLGKRCSAPQLEMIARLFLGGNSHILIHFNGAISTVPQLVDPL